MIHTSKHKSQLKQKGKDWLFTGNRYRLSRSKTEEFLKCPRCSVLYDKEGIPKPSFPQFTLNTRTDTLIKKDFDKCRTQQKPHPFFKKNGLSHIVPLDTEFIEKWRDSKKQGVEYTHKIAHDHPGIRVCGGIDDVLIDTNTSKLVMIDYKSAAIEKDPDWIIKNYWTYDDYKKWYKYQLAFYAHLFERNGHEVSDTGYIYLVNASNNQKIFNNRIEFDEILIPTKIDTSEMQIDNIITDIIHTMESSSIPAANPECRYCYRVKKEGEIMNNNTLQKLIDKAYEDGLSDGIQQGRYL